MKKLSVCIMFIGCAVAMFAQQVVWVRTTPETKAVTVNRYETNYEFHDGLLAVKNLETGLWGFVDESGNKVIDFKWNYEDFYFPRFGGGACLICKKSRSEWGTVKYTWYIIDKRGTSIKLGDDILGVAPFNDDGYARVLKRIGGNMAKEVCINTKGQEVFPVSSYTKHAVLFEILPPMRLFKDGLAAVSKNGKWGFMDRSGKMVCPAIYLEVQDFSEGLACVKVDTEGGRWGFINTTGDMVIPPKFSLQPYPFREGMASVEKRNGKVVMIDRTGVVVSPEYDDIRFFHGGFAFADLPNERFLRVVNKDFKSIDIIKDEDMKLHNHERNGKPTPFINGFCNWDGGFSRDFMVDNWGRRLNFNGETGRLAIGQRTEKLVHVRDGKLDGFADYNGRLVFVFEEEEF